MLSPQSIPGPRCPIAFPWTFATWFGPCGSQASSARRRVTRNMNSVWDTPTLCCLTLCLRCSTNGVSSSIATHSTCPSCPPSCSAVVSPANRSRQAPESTGLWSVLLCPGTSGPVGVCCAPRIKEHRYPGAHCLCRKGLVPGPHCGLGLPPRVEEVPCGVFCVPVCQSGAGKGFGGPCCPQPTWRLGG